MSNWIKSEWYARRFVVATCLGIAALLSSAGNLHAQEYDATSDTYRVRQVLGNGGNAVDNTDWYDSSASYRSYHAVGQPTAHGSLTVSATYRMGPGYLYRVFEGIPANPTINFAPASFTFNAVEGGANPLTQTLSIWTTPAGTTLEWTVSSNATWLTLTPLSGVSIGEVDTVTLSVSIANMPAGTYNATITITAPGATNTPQTVPVQLVITLPSNPMISYSPSIPGHSRRPEPARANSPDMEQRHRHAQLGRQ